MISRATWAYLLKWGLASKMEAWAGSLVVKKLFLSFVHSSSMSMFTTDMLVRRAGNSINLSFKSQKEFSKNLKHLSLMRELTESISPNETHLHSCLVC